MKKSFKFIYRFITFFIWLPISVVSTIILAIGSALMILADLIHKPKTSYSSFKKYLNKNKNIYEKN